MKNFDPASLRLYLVTDRGLAGGREISQIVREAVAGGVTMVQLREKECSTRDFIGLGRELKAMLSACGVPLIINDRVDVALACGADGVHIGQSDMPYDAARRILGPDRIIGLSVESMDDVIAANSLDVDYIGVSPVFSTPTKTDTATPFGLDGLREAVRLSHHPVVGIGGMNLSTAADVMSCGADGIAVVSAIVAADSPGNAAGELSEVVNATHTNRYSRVLTIAGSDSGGGAGIQADIKAISATGSYAASAITAVTVQNTVGVIDVFPIPAEVVGAQIDAVLCDIGADAVKIGMLHSAQVIEAIAARLSEYQVRNIVLDPVMVSTSGHRLIEDSAVETLRRELIPMARVITPNIPEAEILAGERIYGREDLPRIARKLSLDGRVSVLMKAGHLTDDELTDYFYNAEEDHIIELKSQRCDTPNTHGTGCTLSSAFASYLAQGMTLDDAARAAKAYIAAAIESGSHYSIGHGHGPVNHFFGIWTR